MRRLESNRSVAKVLYLLVLSLGLASQGLAAEEVWTSKADMPTARYVMGTCAMDGKVYAIGGCLTHGSQDVGTSAVEVYDPTTNGWVSKGSMPKAEVGLTAAAVDGKIYVIGGILDPRGTYAYDPATNLWTRKADMPTGRWVLSSSVVNGKIYAIGGALTEDGPAVKTVEEYDPATDTWTRKADMPEARYFHTAAVVDDQLYVIGGAPQEFVETATVYAYHPAADTWARKADAPTARSMASASALHGRIYVIGGIFGVNRTMYLAGAGSGLYRPSVEEYDPVTDTWTIKADLPTPRGNLSTIALNDKIYAIGGMKTWSYSLATVEEYDPYPLVVDFNGDGTVDIKDLLRLIESWGQDDSEMDIGPRPFGDGIVDEKDLEVLMGYWGQEVSDPSLVAHWKFDEADGVIASDSAGRHDGVVVGVPVWRQDGGRVKGALELDGATYVTAGHVLSLSDGPFSAFAWIKGGACGQTILSQLGGANWLMADSATGTLMSELKGIGRLGTYLRSEAMVIDSNWHRVGVTWDGVIRRLYVDDTLVAEGEGMELTALRTVLLIGCGRNAAPGSFWSGLIDDVRISSRAVRP